MYNEAVFDLLVAPDDGHEKLQIVRRGKDTVVQVGGDIKSFFAIIITSLGLDRNRGEING